MPVNLSAALAALKSALPASALAAVEAAYQKGLATQPECPLCSRLAAHRAVAAHLQEAMPANPDSQKYLAQFRAAKI